MTVNIEQDRLWNGRVGTHWADHPDRYDAMNGGYNDLLLDAAAVGSGDRVLDIGCGTGHLLRSAVARGADATGIDLSLPMLDRARSDEITLLHGDAQVYPFEEGVFDAAVSRFGVMFFADPVAAFANVLRSLRPGGRIAVVSTTDLGGDDVTRIFASVPDLIEWPAPGRNFGPTSLSAPEHCVNAFTAAGFESVSVTPVSAEQVWGSDAVDGARLLTDWPPVRAAMRADDDGTIARLRARLAEELRPFERDGAVRLRGTAWLTRAVRPGR